MPVSFKLINQDRLTRHALHALANVAFGLGKLVFCFGHLSGLSRLPYPFNVAPEQLSSRRSSAGYHKKSPAFDGASSTLTSHLMQDGVCPLYETTPAICAKIL
jgi:hypothetical protein